MSIVPENGALSLKYDLVDSVDNDQQDVNISLATVLESETFLKEKQYTPKSTDVSILPEIEELLVNCDNDDVIVKDHQDVNISLATENELFLKVKQDTPKITEVSILPAENKHCTLKCDYADIIDNEQQDVNIPLATDLEKETFIEVKEDNSKNTDVSILPENGAFLEIQQDTPKQHRLRVLYDNFRARVFRLRILHTALLSWAAAAAGWRIAMIGPTFPDLMQLISVDVSLGSWLLTAFYIGSRHIYLVKNHYEPYSPEMVIINPLGHGLIQIIGVDVSLGSWLLTTFYIGNMAGSLIGGFLYDRFSKTAVIIGWMVLLAGSTAVVPWCTSFVTMVIAHVIGGAAYGAVDVLVITDVLYVWRRQAVYVLQFVQFFYSIGTIISPLASGPFLSKKIHLSHGTSFSSNLSSEYNTTVPYESSNVSNSINMSGTDNSVYGESSVYVLYMISAALSLLNAVVLILMLTISGNIHTLSRDTTLTLDTPPNTRGIKYSHDYSTKTKLYFVCILALLLMLHLLTGRNFTSYLLSYLVKRRNWTKTLGSAASSVYYIAAATGRLIATPVLVYVELTKTMFIYLCIALISCVLFLISVSIDSDTLIWFVAALLGFGLAPLFPCWFTWLSTNIAHASGKITSALYVTGVGGCSILPPLLGYLMRNYTYDWLVYILLILMGSISAIFAGVVWVHRYLTKSHNKA